MGIRIAAGASVTVKAIMIGAIVLLLLVPLMLLRGLVSERSSLREQAYAKVEEGWGGSLVTSGPVLVIPTERVVTEDFKARTERGELYVLPSTLDADVDLRLEPEPRYVGIYGIPVYLARLRFEGAFDFSSLRSEAPPGVKYLWQEARIRIPLSQVKSLREVKQAAFAGRTLDLGPGSPGELRGVEAAIDSSEIVNSGSVAFRFETVVAGSRALSVLPLGSRTSMTLRSNWPHPSFQGAFLPVERNISADGFSARWQVLELNRSYRQVWKGGEVDEATLAGSAFGVGLYQAVDIYQRGERAIKYALLFIALTFLTFFAWEQVARVRLHPLQYLLVGLALSTFYLLLIALSEHIAFAWSYLVAAVALVLLIGTYISGALRSRVRGLVAAAAMAGVYAVLYVLVLSEDYALLLGAIVLFAALAGVMLVTRSIDWYRLSPADSRGTESDPPGTEAGHP
jgi:inner membrane protein